MNIDRLKKLVDIFSVSSYEDELKNFFKKECEEKDFIEDKLGSVFYLKKSKNPQAKRVMIACSKDEVGLMIKEVFEDGTCSFITLEPLSPASLLHQRVNILTRDNKIIEGFIFCKNVKFNEVPLETIKIDDLSIDTGETDAKNLIKPGDICGFKNQFCKVGNRVISKGLNQKTFIEVILCTIEKLKDIELDFEIALGIVAQSTIGFRGSKTANYVVNPDLAIVINGFEVNNSNPKINLNDGFIVSQFDKQMLPNRLLLNDIKSKYNYKEYFGIIGNDGSFIHKTMNGVSCVSIGIPIKNIHTSVEMIDLLDVKKLEDNLFDYIMTLNNEKIIKLGVSEHEF